MYIYSTYPVVGEYVRYSPLWTESGYETS